MDDFLKQWRKFWSCNFECISINHMWDVSTSKIRNERHFKILICQIPRHFQFFFFLWISILSIFQYYKSFLTIIFDKTKNAFNHCWPLKTVADNGKNWKCPGLKYVSKLTQSVSKFMKQLWNTVQPLQKNFLSLFLFRDFRSVWHILISKLLSI